jgi:hypothetical protein
MWPAQTRIASQGCAEKAAAVAILKRAACGRPRPLEERKAKLQKVRAKAPAGIQFDEHIEGDGAAIFAHACKLGLEGIVSKHREHPYRSGPSKVWLKIKTQRRQACRDFRIGRRPMFRP